MRQFIHSVEGKILSGFMGGLTLLAMGCENLKQQGESVEKIMKFQREEEKKVATQALEEMREEKIQPDYNIPGWSTIIVRMPDGTTKVVEYPTNISKERYEDLGQNINKDWSENYVLIAKSRIRLHLTLSTE